MTSFTNKEATVRSVITALKERGSAANVSGMERFGILGKRLLGVSMPDIRALGKQIGADHSFARALWKTEYHEARILATIVDEPEKVTRRQMDEWTRDCGSWDIVDEACMNLFYAVPFVDEKIFRYTTDRREFVKRMGFALIAVIAWKDKARKNKDFSQFFPLMEREAWDDRIYVKKAVNWALRQVGKRNLALNRKAIAVARRIQKQDARSARWIARDAVRELTSEPVHKRLAEL